MINVFLQDSNETTFSLWNNFKWEYNIDVNMSVNDLEYLNVSYILTSNVLSVLSNDHVTFTKLYEENGNIRIFKVDYHSS